MRRLALMLATTALLCGALFVTAGAKPAWACSCVPLEQEEYADLADVIFAGTLTRVDVPDTGAEYSSIDPVTYVVAVDTVFKGEATEEQGIVTARSGASCGIEAMSVGGSYVVYASRDSVGGPDGPPGALYSGLCSGNVPWDAAAPPPGLGPGRPPSPDPPPTTAAPTTAALTTAPLTTGSPTTAPAPPTASENDGASSSRNGVIVAGVAAVLVAAVALGILRWAPRAARRET